MEHWFLTIALVYERNFIGIGDVQPQINLMDLRVQDVLVSPDDYRSIRKDVIKLVVDIMSEHLPQLAHLKKTQPKTFAAANQVSDKTKVVRLPALPLNEQKYQDVVKILEWLESLVTDVYDKAGVPLEERKPMHVGGDQLTRERFSWAKLLRLGNPADPDRFAHLGPITFEFFHLTMNFLDKVIFRRLFNADSDLDIGTMKCEINRINRQGVDPNIMKAFDADKSFFLSFYKSYVVEGLLTHLGLEDMNSVPHDLPTAASPLHEQEVWIEEKIGSFVDQVIFPGWSRRARVEQINQGNHLLINHE